MQVANLKNENSSLEVFKSSVKTLESEKLELKDKVKQLEKSVTEGKAAASKVVNTHGGTNMNYVLNILSHDFKEKSAKQMHHSYFP